MHGYTLACSEKNESGAPEGPRAYHTGNRWRGLWGQLPLFRLLGERGANAPDGIARGLFGGLLEGLHHRAQAVAFRGDVDPFHKAGHRLAAGNVGESEGKLEVDGGWLVIRLVFGLEVLDVNIEPVIMPGEAGVARYGLHQILVLNTVDQIKAQQLRNGRRPAGPGIVAELVVGAQQRDQFLLQARAGAGPRHHQVDWLAWLLDLVHGQRPQAVDLGGRRRRDDGVAAGDQQIQKAHK